MGAGTKQRHPLRWMFDVFDGVQKLFLTACWRQRCAKCAAAAHRGVEATYSTSSNDFAMFWPPHFSNLERDAARKYDFWKRDARKCIIYSPLCPNPFLLLIHNYGHSRMQAGAAQLPPQFSRYWNAGIGSLLFSRRCTRDPAAELTRSLRRKAIRN